MTIGQPPASAAILACRDQLRDARAQAAADAEGFFEVLFAIERLGTLLHGKPAALGLLGGALGGLAASSSLSSVIPSAYRTLFTPFPELFDIVREARNDALHHGAFARHLTGHAIELSLVLEDALMANAKTIGDFMVRNVTCAELWQPLAFLRQTMLANSFSCLPVKLTNDSWALISDAAIASALRQTNPTRTEALGKPLDIAISEGLVTPVPARVVEPTDDLSTALGKMNERPAVVLRPGHPLDILGIVTAFDLM